jgi:hypothetical protein
MRLVPVAVALLCLFSDSAQASLITFEGFPDSTILSDQYQGLGVSFENAEILTAQYSLNEADFPPHSGVNVAIDDGGPMLLSFASPIIGFSGYFTYTEPLTLQGYDDLGNPLANIVSMSQFFVNTVSSFDPSLNNTPNEFIQLGDGSDPFSQVSMTGDPGGFSFVVDDISFVSAAVSAAPEPASLFFCGSALLILLLCRRHRICRAACLSTAILIMGLNASAQLITTSISPSIIDPNTPTSVTIVADFLEPPIPDSVILQQIDSEGNIINPNLGTLLMISPTAYYITYTFDIDEGSEQVQVSAAFADQPQRNTSKLTLVAGCPEYRHAFTESVWRPRHHQVHRR